MIRYMLDTNTVSEFIRGNESLARQIIHVPMAQLAISAVVAGELHYGIAKRPDAVRLRRVVHEFLIRVQILPWDESVAQHYGTFRASVQNQGLMLTPLDMMIAAHAHALGTVLISHDGAFKKIPHLQVEDWLLNDRV
jgi:tRNA(fMet)-specific endonuclease VapC